VKQDPAEYLSPRLSARNTNKIPVQTFTTRYIICWQLQQCPCFVLFQTSILGVRNCHWSFDLALQWLLLGSTLNFLTTCPLGKCKVRTGCPKEIFTCPMPKTNENGGNLVVCWASSHGNLLARQPDFVVPGKRTVLSVEPCTTIVWIHRYSCNLPRVCNKESAVLNNGLSMCCVADKGHTATSPAPLQCSRKR
jgi:hypothetical protein